jgi:predicted TIM-barrel fold metal-dependent hydrolase
MPSTVIDFHVHAFPSRLGSVETHPLRAQARSWLRPVQNSAHQLQTMIRHLPSTIRKGIDEIGSLLPLPAIAVESTVADLLEAMEHDEIDRALVIAHPNLIPNEFVLEAAAQDPRLLAVVNIPPGTPKPGATLKNFIQKGARALKIHPAADGMGSESKHYRTLVKTAGELGIPVIIHTGCLHSSLLFKSPSASRAEHFTPWFEMYPDTRFVLAHMNYHEPGIAIDLMIDHPNVYADTSWQPAETIAEAVRNVGAERVLFGSDWPLLGNNFEVSRGRIRECIEMGWLTKDESKLILGENAARLLNL